MQNKSGLYSLAITEAKNLPETESHADAIDKSNIPATESLYFTVGTAGYNQTGKQLKNNPYYNNSITFKIPRVRVEQNSYLKRYLGRDLVAVVIDQNMHQWLVGTRDYPLRLKIKKANIPQTTNKFNGYELELSGKNPELALEILDGTVPKPGVYPWSERDTDPTTRIQTPNDRYELTLPAFEVAFIRFWWKEDGRWLIGEMYATHMGSEVDFTYSEHSPVDGTLSPQLSLQQGRIMLTLHTVGISEVTYIVEKY